MQLIMPVWSDGTTSVEESTTGRKPAARMASTLLGSPSQAKTLALRAAISAGVRKGWSQNIDMAPMRLHWSTS